MAHLIEQMAYVGATPWHGLGSQLSPKQPLEVWQQEAGMNWQIQESPVHFMADVASHLGIRPDCNGVALKALVCLASMHLGQSNAFGTRIVIHLGQMNHNPVTNRRDIVKRPTCASGISRFTL